jgi:hypothetical protein
MFDLRDALLSALIIGAFILAVIVLGGCAVSTGICVEMGRDNEINCTRAMFDTFNDGIESDRLLPGSQD